MGCTHKNKLRLDSKWMWCWGCGAVRPVREPPAKPARWMIRLSNVAERSAALADWGIDGPDPFGEPVPPPKKRARKVGLRERFAR